jgi:hypothetical protein
MFRSIPVCSARPRDGRISERPAHDLPTGGDGSGRTPSVTGGNADISAAAGHRRKKNPEHALGVSGRVVSVAVANSGGGTRTPDTRIMIPRSDSANTRPAKPLRLAPPSLAAHGQRAKPDDPDLAALIDSWDSLPEAIRAGIMAMVRASSAGKEKP